MIELISLEVKERELQVANLESCDSCACANDLIIGKINLLDVGIMKISHITIELEEHEIKLQKDFDKALKQYIEVAERYPYHSGGIIDIVKEEAKIKLNRLREFKNLRSRWNNWFNEIFSYH